MSAAFRAGFAAFPGAALLVGAVAAASPSDPFTLVLLPDAQHYTQSAALQPLFEAQTQWVVASKVFQNIVFVSQVGDIVKNGGLVPDQWLRASAGMAILDGVGGSPPDGHVPYSVAHGDNDFEIANDKSSGSTSFVSHFGPARYAGRSWHLGASADGRNHAQLFRAHGREYLHLALEFRPHDDAIEWARGVLSQWPHIPAVLTTHQYLRTGAPALLADSGATSNSAGDNSGLDVFGKLVEPYPQIVLTLCGHTYGDGRRTDTTKLGVTTHAVLANYQDDPNGGNGWMQRLRFVPAQSRLEVRTFSPSFTPGLTPGPNRALAPEGNFDLDLDLEQHIEDLLATTTLHFSRGFDHGFGVYGGAFDTHVGNGASGVTLPGVSYGAVDTLRVDLDDDREQALLRFDDIIGSSPGQIPPGATIQRAILTLTSEGQGAATLTGAALHRMLIPWSEASTWNSLGAGVQLGVEAASTPDLVTAATAAEKGTHSYDVTASVQAWANGQTNWGWVFMSAGTDRWDFRSSDWPQSAERPLLTVRFTAECPVPARYCPTTTNSYAHAGARIDWSGSTSVAANALTLSASSLPPGKSGLFFYGLQRVQLPFVDGFRCVSNPVLRIGPLVTADASGQLARTLDFTAPPLSGGVGQATPGVVLHFQFWYRDAQGPGGQGSNLSDALAIRLCQ